MIRLSNSSSFIAFIYYSWSIHRFIDQLDHQPEISLRYCDDEACDDAVATGRYKVLQDDLRLEGGYDFQ